MKGNVLFVDDESHVTDGLKRQLHGQPYAIFTANNLASAFDILINNEIDVVVSDENMPGIQGVEFLEKIKVDHPSVVRVMLTGSPSLETAVDAINRGEVYRFLSKPCSKIELFMTLNNALNFRQLLMYSRRLLNLSKQQQALLRSLEENHPGITQVERNTSGAILIGDNLDSVDSLLLELKEQVEGRD